MKKIEGREEEAEAEANRIADAVKEIDDETKSQATSNIEPRQADIATSDEKWNSVVRFMRQNPRILMKIIPDSFMKSSPRAAPKSGCVSKL